MEKLNRGLRRGSANKENGVPSSGQDASAGFEKVFQACAEDGKAIRSKHEWRRFVATLQYRGLVSKKELKVLDAMWADITEAAIATGDAKRPGNRCYLSRVYRAFVASLQGSEGQGNPKYNTKPYEPGKQLINFIQRMANRYAE